MATIHSVKPLSDLEIEHKANMWRDALCPANAMRVDIVYALQNKFPSLYSNFRLIEVDSNDIDGNEATTTFKPPRIMVSKNVLREAIKGKPRARFTLAHELGHLVLHKEFIEKSFARAHNVILYKNYNSKINFDQNAEVQANKFAANFLMPKSLMQNHFTVEDIIFDFGVSEEAAKLRLKEINRTRGKPVPKHIEDMIQQLKIDINDQ